MCDYQHLTVQPSDLHPHTLSVRISYCCHFIAWLPRQYLFVTFSFTSALPNIMLLCCGIMDLSHVLYLSLWCLSSYFIISYTYLIGFSLQHPTVQRLCNQYKSTCTSRDVRQANHLPNNTEKHKKNSTLVHCYPFKQAKPIRWIPGVNRLNHTANILQW